MRHHTQSLPHGPEAARDARRVVASLMDGSFPAASVESAALLTSEIVTNAVLHGTPPLRLVIEIAPDLVRVEVHDANHAPPVRRTPAITEPGGRGLAIVEALATRWGTQPAGEGKSVWFELTA